jgi:hypothetical protein
MEDIYPGTSILLPKPGHETRHLWVVLTEPDGDPIKVVAVNLTTRRPDTDTTAILQAGDHPFLTKETIVHYVDARFIQVEPLRQLLTLDNYDFDEDCSDEILERIQRGLLDSRYTPKNIKDYCRERFRFDASAG